MPALGLFQEQVEPSGAEYHTSELECCGSVYQEDPAWKPGFDLLPKSQRPVRPTQSIKLQFKFSLW